MTLFDHPSMALARLNEITGTTRTQRREVAARWLFWLNTIDFSFDNEDEVLVFHPEWLDQCTLDSISDYLKRVR
tara:strand:- start:177 stop:398 length:222 start_codon:yes stop_codon:yes gene_type:complete